MAQLAYVPILTGKQGEFDALATLPDDTRAALRPVIDLPPLRHDTDPVDLINSLLHRVCCALGDESAAAVDLQALDGQLALGVHPVQFLLDRAPWFPAHVRLSVRTDAPASYIDAV